MTSTTTKLSVIVLYREKDRKFHQAVASAQFADQIITVKNTEITDFSQVRNQSQQQAKHEWIFFLDSDEVIHPCSIPEIKQIIENNTCDGVIINRQDIFYNQTLNHGEAGQIKLIRMGKKDKIIWKRPVHEVAQVNGKIKDSRIRILHQAHSSFEEFLSSIISYSQIEAKYRIEHNHPIKTIDLITFPVGKFLHNYFFKKGFLDSWPGLGYAFVMSLHSLLVRVFQYELKNSLKS